MSTPSQQRKMDIALDVESGDVFRQWSAAARLYCEITKMAEDPPESELIGVECDTPSNPEVYLMSYGHYGERTYGAFYKKVSGTPELRVNELYWTQDQVNSIIDEFAEIWERAESTMKELESIAAIRCMPDFPLYMESMFEDKKYFFRYLNIVEGSSRAVRFTPVILKNKKKSVTFACMRMVVILGILRRDFDSILETLPQEPTGDLLDLKTHLEGSIECLSNFLQELNSVILKFKNLDTVTLRINAEMPDILLVDVEPKPIPYVVSTVTRFLLKSPRKTIFNLLITASVLATFACALFSSYIIRDLIEMKMLAHRFSH